ncbi:NADPH2:quinone reductase [Actinacidiphila yanglinensis]|uniref:NADPH2:quinone reductase n=1 Tax=Actinacidiphila yanglinensis TaxID=310779 RepID=A0A1H6DTF7_9ACTN|nr:zinc-binding alcohol dehydrogenase family protein [Actinacidiphila yanglinensis]SEG88548.1 NADPH2:quinone reductase [Actinacidiphila yanglinensis]
MKSVELTAAGAYRLVEAEQPRPGPGEVAVRVAWAGIQYGDVLVRDGHFPVPRPFVPGFEVAGHITAVGAGVDPARAGEAVLALPPAGGYAEVAVAPAALAVPVGAVSLRDAAGLGWGGPTAYDLVYGAARIRPGDRVLVHAAAGGVGILAGQLARAAGAASVTGVAGTPARAAHAAGFGYGRTLTRAEFAAGALAAERFDAVLDPVGGATREASLALLADHGRLVAYGSIATSEPVRVASDELLARGLSLLTHNGNLLGRTHPERLAASMRAALDLVAAGDLRVGISAAYELADLATAVHRLGAGVTLGKSVVRVAPPAPDGSATADRKS